MHAENPDGLTIHGDLCRHRAARFQIRDMQYAMLQYFSRLAHQYGVPVPSKAVHLHVQRDWLVVAVQFQQMSRNCGYAWPKAAIRFLQGNDVRVDLIQDFQYSFGIMAPVSAEGLAHVVTDRKSTRLNSSH